MARINVLCLFRNFVTLNLYKKEKIESIERIYISPNAPK
nr:MAG TPA: hypothetical protein [Caudoviricetes sp.]